MALKYAILGILADVGPQSGYDLKALIEQGPGHVWTADLSQIYRTLGNLVTEKLVEVEEDEDSARGRKVYSITAKGLGDLTNWLSEDYEMLPVREPMLLRLFFGGRIPRTRVIEQLLDYKTRLEALQSDYDNAANTIAQGASHRPTAAMFWQFTLEMGQQWLQTSIKWCEQTLQKLEQETE